MANFNINLKSLILRTTGAIIIVFSAISFVLPGCRASGNGSSGDAISYNSLKSEILSAASGGNEPLAEKIASFSKTGGNDASMVFILAQLPADVAEERLSYLSRHASRSVKLIACEALGIRGDEVSFSILTEMAGDADESVRAAAFEAIAALGSRSGERIFHKKLKAGSRDYAAALKALGDSKLRSLWPGLAAETEKSWGKEFGTPQFFDRLMTLRRIMDANTQYNIVRAGNDLNTPEMLHMIGILGDEWSLKILMDITSFQSQNLTDESLFKSSLEALSIVPYERAAVHLLVIRKNALEKGDSRSAELADAAIANAFRFNEYLILKGDDDFKYAGLKSLLVFATTGFRDEAERVVLKLKSEKPGNPLIANAMKNCLLFIEKQR